MKSLSNPVGRMLRMNVAIGHRSVRVALREDIGTRSIMPCLPHVSARAAAWSRYDKLYKVPSYFPSLLVVDESRRGKVMITMCGTPL